MTAQNTSRNHRPVILAVAVLAALQFAAAIVIGNSGALANSGLSMFPPIAISAFVPVIVFFGAYALSERFRQFVLSVDLRTLTLLQMWRVVGFTFLTLYAYDVLPGLFAWPAGAGDVAVGLMAFVVLRRLDRDPDYGMSTDYLRFHWLGLFDFAVAVATAGLAAGAFPALIPGGITTSPMDVWPLNIFPSFGVPAFIILHSVALLKVRQLRRLSGANTTALPQAA